MSKRSLLFFAILAFIIFFWALPTFAEMIVDTAWVRRYNGPENGYDRANAIAVDGSGNVYVTGYSYSSATLNDYATIKYYPDGDTAWVRRYNGQDNYTDEASAMVIDESSNVYVTGISYGSGSYNDYATIKYYPNGDTVWVRRYNGPGNYADEAHAIVVDGSGNVYVTGNCNSGGTDYDYATIKYYPNGDTAWVRIYNGPGNSNDWASAVVVDNSGNVYVTGQSWIDQDYTTIKYYPNGDTAWVRRYNGPGNNYDGASAITVDRSGNVYVTGWSVGIGTEHDYATMKYYPNGDTAWVRRYNGPGNSDDAASPIAVDSSGNVYVTGWSVGNGTNDDFATIKYYPNGDTTWVRRYNGPGNTNDLATSIAVDGSGNIYVAGASYGIGTYFDYATIKYYPNGDTAWVRRYNGLSNLGDGICAIAVDGSRNVYVTGWSNVSGTDMDFATIKYFQALRGDVNGDRVIDIGDVVYLINYLFRNGSTPIPVLRVGDCNCDGVVDVGDVVYLINFLFKSGPAPSC